MPGGYAEEERDKRRRSSQAELEPEPEPTAARRADGVLLLGFGGPTPGCCRRRSDCSAEPGCEAPCFVAKVLGDDPRQQERVEEVAAHYRELGGTSPYNALSFQQAELLGLELSRRGYDMPVHCGFRNWPPWYADGLRELRRDGCRDCILVVLAPHQCSRSWDDYLEEARADAAKMGPAAPRIAGEIEPYYDHPGYVEANAAMIRQAVRGWEPERFAAAELLLTAHAIPQPAEQLSPYRSQIRASAGLIAVACDHPEHQLAFQSAPDGSAVPWSHPSLEVALRRCAARGVRDVVIQAIGFLVDHVEVRYDLDVEARALCESLGLRYTRAHCVHDDERFIAALADRVLEADARLGGR